MEVWRRVAKIMRHHHMDKYLGGERLRIMSLQGQSSCPSQAPTDA